MVNSHWVDYPYRRRNWWKPSRYQTSRRYPSRKTRRYGQGRAQRPQNYTNVGGIMYATEGFFGGEWSVRHVVAPGVLGPWGPALT